MSSLILNKIDQSIPSGVAMLLQPVMWDGEEAAKKAALVVQRVVGAGSSLREAAREAGLTVKEARELVRTGWFGELVSQAVGSKLVVMSEFRCARLRERMEMIEEQVDSARNAEDGESLLKWLEQARKEMESGKGLEGVMEALSSRNGGPMIQVNIGRYEESPSRAATMRDGVCKAEYEVESEVIGDASHLDETSQVAQREAAQEVSQSQKSDEEFWESLK